MKKNIQALMAAVTLGAGFAAAPMAFGQGVAQPSVNAGLTRQEQEHQEKAQHKQAQQASKAEKQGLKHEREQLNNMPEAPRKVLRAETQNAKDVDYYRLDATGDVAAKGEKARQFGAKFTAANGHQMNIRVDREGKVLAREDLTTATAAAQTPATAAQQPAPATPTTPAPSRPTASAEAPESGNAMYRRLQANEVPQNIRTIFDKDTSGAKDVRYYRTKYGSQLAYEAKWDDAKTGKEMRHYVSDAGQTLVRGESNDNDDNARTASANSQRDHDADHARHDNDRDHNSDRDRNHHDDNATTAGSSSSAQIKTGRAELKDLPRPVQTYFSRSTEGAKDVKFYNTKYGSQQAYQADFKSSDGKSHTVVLDQNGKVLSQKGDSSSSSK